MPLLKAPFPATPLPAKTDVLRLLPLSDLHLPKDSSRFITQNRALLERVDQVVLMGDMVSAYGTNREYRAVGEFLGSLAKPYTAISGNHEWFFREYDENSGLYGEVWEDNPAPEAQQKIERFRRFYGVESLYYSFQNALGTFVFLSLDSVGTQKQETLSAPQSRWLESQIRGAQSGPLWVFCHAPLLLDFPLDFVYYDESRTGCIEPQGSLKDALRTRKPPTFWMSGHVHLHPDHYLFPPYKIGGNVTQVHLPDSWGYGRWNRKHRVPQRYDGPFSRLLEIEESGVSFVTIDHPNQSARESYRVDF